MRRIVLFLPLLSFMCLAAQNRPNIIYIMADDLGYADLSCYGRMDYQTPNLDKLCAQGMKFTNAYAAAPLCTPTRTGFQTGRYPARTPVGLREPLDWTTKDTSVGLTSHYTSLPTLLKRVGYETFLVGKWHLGFAPQFSPTKNGYDYFFGFHGGGIDYISHADPKGNNDLFENDQPVTRDGYMTDLLMEKSIELIRQKHTKPFFLTLMFNAPHWPWQAPGDKPYPTSPTGTGKEWYQGGSAATYAAIVKSMDEAVGKIMQVLDETKLSANTVVIFTSDNGGEKFSDMGGFARKKGQLWEGGIREPAFVRWPGKIKPKTITDQPITTLDFTATILALAKAKADPAFPLDGINLLPVLTSTGRATIPRTLYWRVSQRAQQKAIRDGKWKYLQDENGEYLFDLVMDPGEQNDLKDQQKQIFEKLKKKFAEWEKTVLPPVPLK